ncbi:MAG TPA: protein kinase [Candidatus Acidoferrum sp.]|nr:protein kinase [Candidatus Acidoferrum sp.]
MGRVLVIYPEKGFLALVRRALAGLHEVEAFEQHRAALNRLAAGSAYETVLCAVQDTAAAIAVFEKALAGAPGTRLIALAVSEEQLGRFRDEWNSDARRREANPRVGQAWLRLPCTVGDLLAVCGAPAEGRTRQPAEGPVRGRPAPARAAGGTEQHGTGFAPEAGALIEGYRLIASIGQGGFGTLWLAANEATGRRVAVKFVRGKERVPQELSALRKYVHVASRSEHLVQVEHINHDESGLWMVTELADSTTGGHTGESYRAMSLANQLQARGHLPEREAVGIAIGVGRGLSVLHGGGLLHGDVAPGNVLCVRGRWVLCDPGLVCFIGEHGICRNRTYYPNGPAARPGDDLYAVGRLLWEMTSGVAEMISGAERLRLEGNMLEFLLRSDLPLAKVICRAAAENPQQRYLNSGEMLRDLETAAAKLNGEPEAQCAIYNLPRLRTLRTDGALPPLAGS